MESLTISKNRLKVVLELYKRGNITYEEAETLLTEDRPISSFKPDLFTTHNPQIYGGGKSHFIGYSQQVKQQNQMDLRGTLSSGSGIVTRTHSKPPEWDYTGMIFNAPEIEVNDFSTFSTLEPTTHNE